MDECQALKIGNTYTYLDIEIDGRRVGRIEIELFVRDAPK